MASAFLSGAAVTIDPKLFKQYTGKHPGEAMNRYGESLAKKAAKGPPGDTSFMGAAARGRWYVRVAIALGALGGAVYFLLTMKNGS